MNINKILKSKRKILKGGSGKKIKCTKINPEPPCPEGYEIGGDNNY